MLSQMHPLVIRLLEDKDFVEIGSNSDLVLDLRYATDNNFMGKNVYHDFNRAFLHRVAADKFSIAKQKLKQVKPDWKFILFDCLRPVWAHQQLWDFVAGTPQQDYVADPKRGSLHSYGFAIDLSLVDENDEPVDMGTDFDSFEDLAQPKYESMMLANNKLTRKQYDNRLILRQVMEFAGFIQLSFEWWHYDAEPGNLVRGNYRIIG